jgi:hypothetical protein
VTTADDTERETPSFVRRNLNAQVEAVLDEATQRNQGLLERLREMLGTTLDEVLTHADMEGEDDP